MQQSGARALLGTRGALGRPLWRGSALPFLLGLRWRSAEAEPTATAAAAKGTTQPRRPEEEEPWDRREPFYDTEEEGSAGRRRRRRRQGEREQEAQVSTLLPTAVGDEMRAFEAPDEPLFQAGGGGDLAAALSAQRLRLSAPLVREQRLDERGRAVGVGKKKAAVARAFVAAGDGKFLCNGRSLVSYFPAIASRSAVLEPLLLTERLRNTDVVANVHGGGAQGQAEAVRHAIARALERFDPEYRPVLKKVQWLTFGVAHLLTRDPRVVERKKPGKPKARKSFQWLKR